MAAKAEATGVRTMDAALEQLLDADTHPENINPALRINSPLPPGPAPRTSSK